MLRVTTVRDTYESLVEANLIRSALVSTDKQDGLTLRVEGKGHAPHTALPVEAQFLHVRESRPLERVYLWSAQLWTVARKVRREGKQLIL